MIYLAFFKSLITTIKPIFFRFFSIIKYLILALLAILLYMLVGRVGAWNIGDVASIVEFQYNDTGHNRGLEHIDYSANMLSRGDAYYITTTEKQNPLRYNYSYSKGGYKVLYNNNSIWGIFAFKKGTFTHTIGYPYGITGFAKIEIPTNGFLGGIANIFSSKKFKNLVVNNNGFIFFNENENDLEINSHVCGKEFPGYYFMHIIRHQPLRVFDFKNKLVYEYDSVPSLKNGPNSGGCWILPYLEQEADRVYKFTYSSNRNYGRSLFVSNAYYTTTINHTNGNFRLFLTDKNQLNEYKRSYKLGEQISEKKIPEQYQAEYEEKQQEYQSSPSYSTCQDDYNHVISQSFSLINCKIASNLYVNTTTGLNYFSELLNDGTMPMDGTGTSFLINGRDPFEFVGYPEELKACQIWVSQENKYYKTKVAVPDSTGFIPDVEKRMLQYKIILKKQFLNTYQNSAPFPSMIDYCGYNQQYANSNVNNNPIDFKTQIKNEREEIVSFINSGSYGRSGTIKDNRPLYVRIGDDLKNKYFNIQKKTFVSGLNNYCKENGNQFANNIYYFIIFLFGFYFIKLFN